MAYKTLVIGAVIGVIASTCAPTPSTEPPPSTLTTTSTTTIPPTTTTTEPSTTTTLFGEPVDLVVYPPSHAVDKQIDVCGSIPAGLDPTFLLETNDRSRSTEMRRPTATIAGDVAACWNLTVPAIFVEKTGSRTTRTTVTAGDYRLVATVGDQIVGTGSLTIVEPFEDDAPISPWRTDPAFIRQMIPVAVSNAHTAGASGVVVHGGLAGTVDVALPFDAYGAHVEPVHLWSNPDGQPPEPIYEIFSDVEGNWLYRSADFELGDQGFVDAALASPGDRPAMSIAQELAWAAMGRQLVPYLRILESGDDGWRRTELSLYDPSNGHTYHLSIMEGSGDARDEWGYEPLHYGYMEGLAGSNGKYSVQLGVTSRVSQGDTENPSEPPPLQVDIDDLRVMLNDIIAMWEKSGSYPDDLLSYEARHISFLRSVVHNADGRLNGPFRAVDWTGETEPAPNQIPVITDDGTWPWVTFYPAPEATTMLSPDAKTDFEGPQAVFVAPDTSWFFCLDTGFSVPSDTEITFTRSLAAEVCRIPST